MSEYTFHSCFADLLWESERDALEKAISLLGDDDDVALPEAAKVLNLVYRDRMLEHGVTPKSVTIRFDYFTSGVVYESGDNVQRVESTDRPDFGRFDGDLTVTLSQGLVLYNHILSLLNDARERN